MGKTLAVAIVALVCGLISCCGICGAIEIALTGSWSPVIGAADLIGGAGTDLAPIYESSADAIAVTISSTTGSGDNWRVDVMMTDINWPAGFDLFIRRTGDGTGSGSIAGGAAYQQITDGYAALFSGAGDRLDIPLQLKLTGVSVHTPPDTYSATVTYTVVDTL